MKIITRSLLVIVSLTVIGIAQASERDIKEEKAGRMMGLSFETDSRSNVTKIMDEQASKPVKGGELSQGIYVLTQERIAETFSRPIPDSINESTRDD